MANEVIKEALDICKNKKGAYLFKMLKTVCYSAFIASMPYFILEICSFILSTIFKVLNLIEINAGFLEVVSLAKIIVLYFGFILATPIFFGCINFFRKEVSGEKFDNHIFKFVKIDKNVVKQMIVMLKLTLGTTLGLMLFLIPGWIYFSNRIMLPLVLLEDEEMPLKIAERKSREVIKNRRNQLFDLLMKIYMLPIILYVIAKYITRSGGIMVELAKVLETLSLCVLLIALTFQMIALPVMYNKIKGKKSGAIDVEFKEIN